MARKSAKKSVKREYDPDRAFGTSLGKSSRKSSGYSDVDIKTGGDVRIPGAEDIRALDKMSTSPALRGRTRSPKKTGLRKRK